MNKKIRESMIKYKIFDDYHQFSELFSQLKKFIDCNVAGIVSWIDEESLINTVNSIFTVIDKEMIK